MDGTAWEPRWNFGLGAVISAVFGFAMGGSIYLRPRYLTKVPGHNAQQIGVAIMSSGTPQLLLMPVTAARLKKLGARIWLTAGIVLIGASYFMNYSRKMLFMSCRKMMRTNLSSRTSARSSNKRLRFGAGPPGTGW